MLVDKTKTAAGGNHVGYYHSYKYQSLDLIHRIERMHGIKRVVVFCILTTVLPTILLIVPLYLRHSVYADVPFAVTESDIVEITDGISPIFCSEHKLRMNETFNAFQVSRRPEKTQYRKHIRLKKSMKLPDDTLEYWGFYLLKGATVALSVCSRYEGASILVVKGERNLRTCGMLEHNKNKAKATGIYLPEADQQVKVTYESNAEEVNSKELVPNSIKKESQPKAHSAPAAFSSDSLLQVKDNSTTLKNTGLKSITDDNHSGVDKSDNSDDDEEFNTFLNIAEGHINKTYINMLKEQNPPDKKKSTKKTKARDDQEDNITHHKSHRKDPNARKKLAEKAESKKLELDLRLDQDNVEEENHGQEIDAEGIMIRRKRSQQPINPELLDRGIRHGGNNNNQSEDSDSSVSSFENGLLNCYGGNVLLAHEFDPSEQCNNVDYLLRSGNKRVQTVHEVAEDGYYYYIFYSDNDMTSNDIHAVFEIYKPTLQYENVSKACINKTECSFPLPITSIDRVIVEVPTRDGIDHELDDISILVSTCVPRMGVYVIFPIAVLFFVLGCAFL